ncbi:MAG: ABC transporter permease [Proteobacteria bacterium]|nr:ABC transporter permease [Pseudomonadota bacterium]
MTKAKIAMERMRITRIQAKRNVALLDWKELIQYRDLLYYLALRDLKLRYRQTGLGVGWVILQPLVPAFIFAVLFGNFARLPSNGQPYLLLVLTGLIPWTVFGTSITKAGGSLVANASMISKIYFPRIIIPLSATAPVLVDAMANISVMIPFMVLFKVSVGWHLVAAPVFLIISFLMGTGVSLIVTSLNVYYRDVGYAMPFLLQIWNYLTPVVYSSELIPEKWKFLYSLNPLAGLIEGFRWSILGGEPISATMSASMLSGLMAALFAGLAIFKKVERGFADYI